jgi:hypothetical protein
MKEEGRRDRFPWREEEERRREWKGKKEEGRIIMRCIHTHTLLTHLSGPFANSINL